MSLLPQEFPRELALLQLADVAPELPPAARAAYEALFAARRAAPLAPGGALLVGSAGLRPLMALMRLLVLRVRDLNLEAFAATGARPNYRSAYVRGAHLTAVPAAHALFVERADQVPPELAAALGAADMPIFATWEGPESGPVWDALVPRCDLIRLR